MAIFIVVLIWVQVHNLSPQLSLDTNSPLSSALTKDVKPQPGHIRLILHVGPSKTATTTIQCNLASLEWKGLLSDLLAAKIVEIEACRPTAAQGRKRNLKYREQFYSRGGNVEPEHIVFGSQAAPSTQLTMHKEVVAGHSFLPHCIPIWTTMNNETTTSFAAPDCWSQSYAKYIHNYHSPRGQKNLFIISNEELAGYKIGYGNIDDPKQCRGIFDGMLATLGADSSIEIVYTQRYYFDFLVSMHGQEHDAQKSLIKPKFNNFDALSIPTIEKYVTSRAKGLDKRFKAMECFRAASQDNSRVDFKVIDFRGNVTSSFFNILSKGHEDIASRLAKSVSQKRRNTASSRQSNFVDTNLIPYDRIAMAAAAHNLIPEKMRKELGGRYLATKQIKQITEERNIELIYKCPSRDFYNKLLRQSIDLQKAAFPLNDKAEEEVTKTFWAAVEAKKFCDVDGEAMVANAKEFGCTFFGSCSGNDTVIEEKSEGVRSQSISGVVGERQNVTGNAEYDHS